MSYSTLMYVKQKSNKIVTECTLMMACNKAKDIYSLVLSSMRRNDFTREMVQDVSLKIQAKLSSSRSFAHR